MSLRPSRVLAAVCLVAAGANSVPAAAPSLGQIMPRGVQRGTEADLYFNGARLGDAKEIFFYSPGFTVLKLEAPNDNQAKVQVKVAGDARLGEHAARVRTATGISELRTFFVGALPATDEKEPNSDFAQPQKVPLNVTVTGVVDNEDVDYFVVEAKKGQRISAEIEAMRLGNTIFDPYLAILNARRFELAASDDAPVAFQDAAVSIVAPEDGVYIVQARETSYGGNGACQYRLHIGTFPRPTAVFPAGGKIGEEVELRFLGDPTGVLVRKLKPSLDNRFGLFAQDDSGIAPSPNPFRPADCANVLEVEPNNDHATATAATLPMAFNGVIGSPGDVDCFKFKAAKGQTFDVHCYARRLRSPLDPVMTVYHAGGGGIVGNDDAAGPDSYIRFTAPEDKEYVLLLHDHLKKGGPDYVYRVEFTPVRPNLVLTLPKIAQFSQERQMMPIPRGNRNAVLVVGNRADFGGPLVIGAENLPKGVSIQSENMAANLNVVPVVFEAAPDAPIAGTLANLIGQHADPNQKISGGFTQTLELVTGPPGQSVYWTHTVDRLAVAVTDEAPFKLAIVQPKVPLVQNGSMNLKIVAERKPGFKAAIGVQMLFNPPGVGSAPGITIGEGQNEAEYPMNANSGAEVRQWKIAVIGAATVGNGPVWVSSPLTTLEVAKPFVTGQIAMTTAEQGKPAEVVCKLGQQTPFDGKAKIQLLGLPAGCATAPVEIAKDSPEVVFSVKTDKSSPTGQHGTLLCQLVVMKNNEPIVHYFGHGGVLRIDPPPPPKPAEPAKPAVAQATPKAAPPPPAEKRLTRLEKLRLEAAERSKTAPKQ